MKPQDFSSEKIQRWQPIWSHIPANIVTLADYEYHARQLLPIKIKALLFENNLYQQDNNALALDARHWQPKVLNPVMPNLGCHLSNHNSAVAVDLFLPHPLWLSPVAHQKLYHPDAEYATREASNLLQTPTIWSCMGNTPFEQLFSPISPANISSSNTNIAQWYWQPFTHSPNHTSTKNNLVMARRHHNLDLINQLIAKGLQILVLTVDAPHSGVRSVSRQQAADLPSYCQAVNILDCYADNLNQPPLTLNELLAAAPTWEDITWLVKNAQVPIFLKGILHPEDAKRAEEIGCAGIIVSNHGRRVLSDVIAVSQVLADIRQHVSSSMIIIADGGVRSGSDMAKLISLGADAVAIGRGYIYGLALAGSLGVAHVNKILLEELQVTMSILGIAHLKDLRHATLMMQGK